MQSLTIRERPRERGRERRRGLRPHDVQPKANVVPPGLPGGQYKPLTDEQIQRIHDAALVVLEETGIEVMPSTCREAWQKAGARIDLDRNRVFIPRRLVEEGLSTAAREVRLCGQSPGYDLVLGGRRVYLGTG
ncbi:MAG: trimethylamine methyltransferase family protein, partial [Anaerolineales bacterium]